MCQSNTTTPRPPQRLAHALSCLWGLALIAGGVISGDPESAQGQCQANELARLLASDGASGDEFGYSSAIFGDTAVIGAYKDDGNTGKAYIFEWDGSAMAHAATLIASDRAPGDRFGVSSDIFGDTVAVGAYTANSAAGAVYVYNFDGASWGNPVAGSNPPVFTESDILIPAVGYGEPGDVFGVTVSIYEETIVVGAVDDDGYTGSAYVFKKENGNWQQKAKLTAFDGEPVDFFGEAAVFGSTVAIGALGSDNKKGSVYVFEENCGWADGDANQVAKLVASDIDPGDQFGRVAISGDTIVAAALNHDSNRGSAYIFEKGAGWLDGDANQVAVLAASDGASGDLFGRSVAVHGDIVVIGAHYDNSRKGSAYVFKRPSGGWQTGPSPINEAAKLTASDGTSYDQVGASVAIDGDKVLVGANYDDDNGANSGSVYVFRGLSDCNENGELDICDIGDGTSSDANGDGTPDECENEAPVAVAVVEQLTNIGSDVLVSLDGSESSDLDHDFSDLAFEWTVDSVAVGSDATIETALEFGSHEILLRVTDPEGAFDEVTRIVTLDPAELSVLEIDKLHIDFEHQPPRAKIHGEIGLPFGVDYSELAATVLFDLSLAGIPVAPISPLVFEVEGGHDHKWKYRDTEGPVRKFDIDWKGARFRYKEHGIPVELKSHVITSSETILTLKYKMQEIGGPFTLDIGGQATVDIDAAGEVSDSTVPFEIEKPHKEITLTLPFTLLDTSVISFSGGVTETLLAGDYLKGSIGRFRIDMDFDAALFPDGAATTPRTVELSLSVGAEGYSGAESLGPDDLKVDGCKWKEKKGH